MKENYPGFRITDLWVFVGIDEDGDEGVMAFHSPGMGSMPMVAADEKRREQFRGIADTVVAQRPGASATSTAARGGGGPAGSLIAGAGCSG